MQCNITGKELTPHFLQGFYAIVRVSGSEIWVQVKKTDLIRQTHANAIDTEITVVFDGDEAYIEFD